MLKREIKNEKLKKKKTIIICFRIERWLNNLESWRKWRSWTMEKRARGISGGKIFP